MKSESFDLTDPDEEVPTILHLDTDTQIFVLDQQDYDNDGKPIDEQWSTVVLTPEQLLNLIAILWDRTDENWNLITMEEGYSVH